MSTLRSKLIRLAHTNPEHRDLLLPILKKSHPILNRDQLVEELGELLKVMVGSLSNLQELMRIVPKAGAAQAALDAIHKDISSVVATIRTSRDDLEEGRHFGPF